MRVLRDCHMMRHSYLIGFIGLTPDVAPKRAPVHPRPAGAFVGRMCLVGARYGRHAGCYNGVVCWDFLRPEDLWGLPMMQFGNNANDGYTAKPYKYEPKWELHNQDWNPDHHRSSSGLWVEPSGAHYRWFLQVKGLGVVTILSSSTKSDPEGRLRPDAMGLVLKADVGPCPRL